MEQKEFFIILSLASVAKHLQGFRSSYSSFKTSENTASMARAIAKEKKTDTVYSTVLPLAREKNYVFLVLGDINSAFQLTLEKGGKNESPVSISLYKNGVCYSSLSLQRRLDWKLASLEPGHYLLRLNEIVVFSFQIRA